MHTPLTAACLRTPFPPTPCCAPPQDHGLDTGLDVHLIPHCRPALVEDGAEPEPVYVEMAVQNVHRAVGTTLSHEVTKRYGAKVRAPGAGLGSACGWGST